MHKLYYNATYFYKYYIFPFLLQMNFDSCLKRETTYPCSIFSDRHPSTVAMTVLVVVEMFNALNNLSENQSLVWVFVHMHLLFQMQNDILFSLLFEHVLSNTSINISVLYLRGVIYGLLVLLVWPCYFTASFCISNHFQFFFL